MESVASVGAFVTKINSPRVDVLLLNAGKATHEFYLAEGNESTIAVNVVNTFLLALLMLPTLRQASEEFPSCLELWSQLIGIL